LGLVPDTVSYIGIALLVGVIIYFVRSPLIAAAFLAGHLICDGLDGSFARNSGKASQSGAFTDLVCDQTGMVVVSLLAIFHGFVSPVLGAVYITLYLIVVVFGVLINVLDVDARITITSKYFLYMVYLAWALWGVNYIPELMYFFSAIMMVEVVVGYIRLKRGIRFKYDSKVRFANGDPYSGRLNYALNVSAPLIILLIIVVSSNWVLLRSFFDQPTKTVDWQKKDTIPSDSIPGRIMGFCAHRGNYLIMYRTAGGKLLVQRRRPGSMDLTGAFIGPGYISPTISSFPVQDDELLITDRSTNMLLGVDLEASFSSRRMVTVMTIPMGSLKVTGLTVGEYKGKTVWLAANFLYTRKTYVIDPALALQRESVLEGSLAGYINGAFPAGISFVDNHVVEYNRSPVNELLYVAPAGGLMAGRDMMEAASASFLPPVPAALGPVVMEKELLMLAPSGEFFSVSLDNVIK
jgi:phosphatidylglycerophosphate synthase